jgi:hypothetical protein
LHYDTDSGSFYQDFVPEAQGDAKV